jgi:hypothetical protein
MQGLYPGQRPMATDDNVDDNVDDDGKWTPVKCRNIRNNLQKRRCRSRAVVSLARSGKMPWGRLENRSRLVKADCVRQLEVAFGALCRQSSAGCSVAAALVTLHVAADTEGFATTRLWALVRLLARVTVAVYPQAAGSGKGFVASGADIAVLGLRELRLA